MNPQPETEWLMREAELRQPTGDTVRLPRLGGVQLASSITPPSPAGPVSLIHARRAYPQKY
jgi:hypothetical protein